MFIEPCEGAEVVVAKVSVSLKQLNVCQGIHIRYHLQKILKVPATDLSKRGFKLLYGSKQELKRVAEYHVWAPLDLEILLHVFANHFDLAVRSLIKLVNDQLRIIFTEVV